MLLKSVGNKISSQELCPLNVLSYETGCLWALKYLQSEGRQAVGSEGFHRAPDQKFILSGLKYAKQLLLSHPLIFSVAKFT